MAAGLLARADAVTEVLSQALDPRDVPLAFGEASRSLAWEAITAPTETQFPWDPASRYLRRPSFAARRKTSRLGAFKARPLLVLGDDMTTDHISPAGWIAPDSAAASWLIERGGDPDNLNVYAAYRGNWEVMLRGLFTNRLVRNYLEEGLSPSETVLDDGRVMPVFEAAAELEARDQSAVLFAGDRYGMGSSRDWAAKGVALLNVRAVIAKSFERINRTNLIGMGILPLQITDGFDPVTSGLSPADWVNINLTDEDLSVRRDVAVNVTSSGAKEHVVSCRAAVETEQEVELLKHGGALPKILESFITAHGD